jgi:hypothetical protein
MAAIPTCGSVAALKQVAVEKMKVTVTMIMNAQVPWCAEEIAAAHSSIQMFKLIQTDFSQLDNLIVA